MRVAVVDAGTRQWRAGSVVSAVMAGALTTVAGRSGDAVTLLTADGPVDVLDGSVHTRVLPALDPLPLEGTVTRLLHREPRRSVSYREARLRHRLGMRNDADPVTFAARAGFDAVLPVTRTPARRLRARAIGWVPDLQHRAFPEYFSGRERSARDRLVCRLSEHCAAVLVSSEVMKRELLAVVPESAAKVHVAPFPSLLALRQPDTNADVREIYDLPPRFALVANQFWAHKNHAVVIDALRILRDGGTPVHVAMTGMLSDYRDPTNQTLNSLLQAIATSGLHEHVRILGMVPHDHVVALLLQAQCVVQPSRYEGWNTTVQDALAVGTPLVCSDIEVHREQAQGADAAFFDVDDADALAEALAVRMTSPPRATNAPLRALERHSVLVRAYGETLLDLCRSVAGAAGGSASS